jgi:RNA polymerase sigma-70 factor (ECF subfamily)
LEVAVSEAKVLALRDPSSQDEVLSDEAVAYACATGDDTAIATLFDRFAERVARYVWRLVDPSDVDDIVQSTFLIIARCSAKYDGRAAVSTWLFSIANNVVRHHLRSLRRRNRLAVALSLIPGRPSHDPSDRLEARRQVDETRRAFDELREVDREAFALCVLEGVSAREAAVALGTSEGAVWKRVSRARKQLRDAVRQQEGT